MLGGGTALDGRLAVWVATHRYAPLNDVFVWLGSIDRIGAVWICLALLVSIALWRRALPVIGATALTALTVFAADSLALGVKDLTHRARPFEAHPQIHPLYTVHSSSLPSGHAATAFAGAVLVSYLAPRATPLFVALATTIAFSRVYVGVHYPGDVLAGAAIGAAVGVSAVALLGLTGGPSHERRLVAHG
jgi:undecaprenyl-diphosphatase